MPAKLACELTRQSMSSGRRGPRGVEDCKALKLRNRVMISGKHLQRGTNPELTFNAFFSRGGSNLYIAAIIREGNRVLARPDLEVAQCSANAPVDDVVIDQLVRYMNETKFGLGVECTLPFTPTTQQPRLGARSCTSQAITVGSRPGRRRKSASSMLMTASGFAMRA